MTPPEKNFTKTEIKRMPVGNLRELASEYGIENAEEKTGEELKDCLISVLGLQENNYDNIRTSQNSIETISYGEG